MTDLTPSAIERRALAILEELADRQEVGLLARLLAGEDPAVVARVRKITAMSPRVHAMPTEMPDTDGAFASDPPVRFGAFRIVELIGEGGMGEVWRGERDDGLFDQIVAIKLIRPHLQLRAGVAFESERRILAGLEHPNIARLVDGGTTVDGRACLVMEYIDGVSFDAGCATLPLDERIGLFRQVLDAVGYAHSRLIAHGDLKPSNILVDRDARVRLLDFGIARLVTDEANAFRLTGAVTSSFASPARLRGEPPSIPDDVFALGRLLTLTISGTVDPDLAAIAHMASATDARSRYASVPEFLADLDRWKRHYPVKAVPRTPSYVVHRYVQRNWQALSAAVLLAIAFGYGAYSYQQTQREHAEASARFDDARGTARYLLFTLYEQLAAHPNTLALRRDVAATAQHYLDRLAQSKSTIPEERLEAAQGLLRLADVEGSPRLANLGRPAAARQNIERALAILKPLHTVEAKMVQIEALIASAYLAEMVEENEARALQELTALQHLLKITRQIRPQLMAEYYVLWSMVDQWRQRYPQAIVASDTAITFLTGENNLPNLMLRSKALELKADAVFYSHHEREAVPIYRSAVAPLELAVRLYPSDMFAHRRLGHILWSLGSSLPDGGEPREAVPILDRSSAEMRRAVAFDADDDDAKRGLNISEHARGSALIANGYLAEGFALISAMTADRKAIWLARPNEERRLRDYAIDVEALADLQGNHRRYSAACPNWREALRLYAIITTAGHLSAQDHANDIVPMLKNVSQHC